MECVLAIPGSACWPLLQVFNFQVLKGQGLREEYTRSIEPARALATPLLCLGSGIAQQDRKGQHDLARGDSDHTGLTSILRRVTSPSMPTSSKSLHPFPNLACGGNACEP